MAGRGIDGFDLSSFLVSLKADAPMLGCSPPSLSESFFPLSSPQTTTNKITKCRASALAGTWG